MFNPPDKDRSESVTDFNETFLGQLLESYHRHPHIFGGADILCVGKRNLFEHAADYISALSLIRNKDSVSAVTQYKIIVPPNLNIEDFSTQLEEALKRHVGCVPYSDFLEAQLEKILECINVVRVPDCTSDSLLKVITDTPSYSAIIILTSSCYSIGIDDADQQVVTIGDELWVWDVSQIAEKSVSVAINNNLYIAIDTGKLGPILNKNKDLLMNVSNCGLIVGDDKDKDTEIIGAKFSTWINLAQEGRIGKVLKEIEKLPNSTDKIKNSLKAQFYFVAGLHLQAVEIIQKEFEVSSQDLPTSLTIRYAKIAEQANYIHLATKLLLPVLETLEDKHELEEALSVATTLCDEGYISQASIQVLIDKLSDRYPNSHSLFRHRISDLLQERAYQKVADELEKNGEDKAADYYRKLESFLSCSELPDYLGLLNCANGDQDLKHSYRLACIDDAIKRKLWMHALDLCLPLPNIPLSYDRIPWLLTKIFKGMFLQRSSEGKKIPIDHDRMVEALVQLINTLAKCPVNGSLRVALSDVCKESVSGIWGIALLAVTLLHFLSRPIKFKSEYSPSKSEMNLEEFYEKKDFILKVFAWLESEGEIILGQGKLPDDLMTLPADDILPAIGSLISNLVQTGDHDDNESLLTWLQFGSAIAPHGTDVNADLRMAHVVANKLSSTNENQLARDLAEQFLIHANTAERKRLAWSLMADVYARNGNIVEALISKCCMFATTCNIEPLQLANELISTIRLFRDNSLFDEAFKLIPKATELLQSVKLNEVYGQRITTLSLQIRYGKLAKNMPIAPISISELLSDAIRNAKEVMEAVDEVAPIANLIGNLIYISDKVGTPIDPSAPQIYEKLLANLNESTASDVRLTSNPSPDAIGLFNMMAQIKLDTRYAEDIGFDTRPLAMFSKRALTSSTLLQNTAQTSFVLELTTDRGIACPGWNNVSAPPPAPSSIEETLDIAQTISNDGFAVLQVGLDSSGQCICLATENGTSTPPTRLDTEYISEPSFAKWLEEFPYRFGIDTTTMNLFYTSTDKLCFQKLPKLPTMLVAATELQSYPPNILRVKGEDTFLGQEFPVASVPSISWLKEAKRQGSVGDGRYCSWISTDANVGGLSTLQVISERLSETLTKHGFIQSNDSHLPDNLKNSAIAVVAAHGALHPDGKYFQLVSDEGVLQISASELARSMRNIDVVILFICSGGRVDKRHNSNTTMGLVKEVLDRGCTTVIASPWPLDTLVPHNWLPPFLDAWEEGEYVSVAAFKANAIMMKRFSGNPALGLAMNVYGNPFSRKQKDQS